MGVLTYDGDHPDGDVGESPHPRYGHCEGGRIVAHWRDGQSEDQGGNPHQDTPGGQAEGWPQILFLPCDGQKSDSRIL